MSPEPGVTSSQANRTALDFTARRFVPSAWVLTPSLSEAAVTGTVRRIFQT